MLTIGSLFAGIGGLELGLERAGLGPVLWQVESDPFCREVLARHWPKAARHDDVRTATALEPVGLLCGGFPCQDLSLAGRGAGLAGERSGLWREFARLVRDLRPLVVVVENVPALARRGLGVVLGDLAESGFDAAWDCIPASAVGAPHRRDRLFVVAWRVSDPVGDAVRNRAERGEGAPLEALGRDAFDLDMGAALSEVAPRAWPPRSDALRAWAAVPPDAQPSVCRVAHGDPARLDRALAALGNAVVPDVAEVVGRAIVRALARAEFGRSPTGDVTK